jgi:hypothetical protein
MTTTYERICFLLDEDNLCRGQIKTTTTYERICFLLDDMAK